jgi:D-alanyl-D-alanine carboxypeptidase (penicillin-binding protein 5/6)
MTMVTTMTAPAAVNIALVIEIPKPISTPGSNSPATQHLAGQILRLLTVLLCLAFLSSTHAWAQSWPEPPKIDATSWVLVDATTGQTLASQNTSKAISPASLTKLMTAYLTFSALRERRIRLDQTVVGPPEAEIPQGPRMFLTPGKNVSVTELLQGLTILNAHDAAIALAKAISGSEAEFVVQMNKTAQRLGMAQTTFANATGVPHPEHRSTVANLMQLSIALINEFPEQLREFGRRELIYNGIRQVNRNRLLWLDSSVDGLVTGRSDAEGYSIAVTAHRRQPLGDKERVQRRLMAIIVGAASEEVRAQEGLKLVNFGFQQFDVIRIFRSEEVSDQVPVFKGATRSARLHFPKDVLVAIPRGQLAGIRTQLERPNALLAPVVTGQAVGQLRIWLGSTEIHQVPVVAAESVKPAGLLGRAIDSARLWVKSL